MFPQPFFWDRYDRGLTGNLCFDRRAAGPVRVSSCQLGTRLTALNQLESKSISTRGNRVYRCSTDTLGLHMKLGLATGSVKDKA